MVSVLKYLASPQTVADFQRFCGVEDLTERYKNKENGTDESKFDNDSNEHLGNGYTKLNGVNQLYSNGFVNGNSSRNGLIHRENNVETAVPTDTGTLKNIKPKYRIKHKFLHFMFHFGASLGNEIFYLVFFPFVLWNIDSMLLRQVAIIWHTAMYLGQALKDVIKHPRPATPPAIPLETRYAEEFGMPSTHASVGSIIPFGLFILSINRYEFDFTVGLLIALYWTILVGLSRIYLGMHSALDVICGLGVACIIMPCTLPLVAYLDELQITYPYAPLGTVFGSFLFCYIYPPTDTWNSARGDTATIHGIGGGIAFGSWLNYYSGFRKPSSLTMPYTILSPSLEWIKFSCLRTLLGCLVLCVIRQVVKHSSIHLLTKWYKLDKKNIQHLRQIRVEVPVKFLTYWTMSVATVYNIPILFNYLGIQRDAYYTEF